MKIGLVDVDRTKFPNLALMKISAYHKSIGDDVEWCNAFEEYDRIYMSKIFTFTPDDLTCYRSKEIVKGGTGYDLHSVLPQEIEYTQPDYALYSNIDNKTAYGFLTRGCPNKCKWCIVPIKEGIVKPYMDVDDIAIGGRKNLVLMDNNILASDYGLGQIEKIIDRGYRVDFNQGIDARLITDDVAKLLAQVKWIDYIRLACDTKGQIPHILKAHNLLVEYGYPKRDIFCYFLIDDFDDANERLNALRQYRWFVPYGQPYRNFNDRHQIIPQWQKDMAHWMNKRNVYRTIDFKDFEPRKGFKCKKYYEL